MKNMKETRGIELAVDIMTVSTIISIAMTFIGKFACNGLVSLIGIVIGIVSILVSSIIVAVSYDGENKNQ